MEEFASQAVEGGVNVVQIREKDLPTDNLYDLAATLHAVLRGRALLIINDSLDVTLRVGADGVHLPGRSLPGSKVRELVTAVRDAVTIPVVAVGGIDATNAADVIAAGADGVAVIGAIMNADDPAGAARDLHSAVVSAYAQNVPAPNS